MNSDLLSYYNINVGQDVIQIKASDQCSLNIHILQNPRDKKVTPILFVHALAMDGNMWQGVASSLAKDYPEFVGGMYALDCRGHGKSGTTRDVFSTKQFADDLMATLNGIGVSKAHIVGCSMGGTVSLAFAGHFPESTASITIIDATAWYGIDAKSKWEERGQKAIKGGMESLIEFQKARWFSPTFLENHPLLVREVIEVFTSSNINNYLNSCRMLGNADERDVLQNYKGPAAIIVGEDDYATPLAMSQDIATRIDGAELIVIPRTRHYTPLEVPDEIANCINRVIKQATNVLVL